MTTLFPVSDFNFVLCGLATIAAGVGYACTRRIATSPSMSLEQDAKDQVQDAHEANPPEIQQLPSSYTESQDKNDSDIIIPTFEPLHSQRPSLKRKSMDDHDEATAEYPNDEGSAYPNKRSKTPPADESVEEVVVPSSEEKPKDEPQPQVEIPSSEGNPENEKTVPDHDSTLEDGSDPVIPSPTPMPESPSLVSTPRPVPIYPPQFSGGFASFAGSASPFGSTAAMTPNDKPVWSTSTDDSDGKAESEVSSNKVSSHAIDQVTVSEEQPVKSVTGEEDEEVEGELKGVKLFRKRGRLDFSIGMHGHVKLLAHKVDGAVKRRIVFRREPLWKVSMNVLLQPVVRCSFDEQESVLRVILKEAEEGRTFKGSGAKLVVYALKPGRSCSKDDFKKFSSLVVAATQETPSQN